MSRRARPAKSKPQTETIVVIAIVSIVVGIGVALAIRFMFAAARVEGAVASSWPLGFFVSPGMPDRPLGVQEEDLPRFVFVNGHRPRAAR